MNYGRSCTLHCESSRGLRSGPLERAEQCSFSPVAMSYVVNHVVVRSVLFFFIVSQSHGSVEQILLAAGEQTLGGFLICINPRWSP